MQKMFRLALIMSLGFTALAGCSGNISTAPVTGLNVSDGAFSLTADGTSVNGEFGEHKVKGMKKGGPGERGGFFLPKELNLTDEQKAQLESLKPEAPSEDKKANMDAVRESVKAAFISDTFDTAALKTEIDSLKPDDSDRSVREAEKILAVYNILTDEQKVILETKMTEEPADLKSRPVPDAEQIAQHETERLDKLAVDLSLTEDQKVSLKTIMAPPSELPNPEDMAAKRKEVMNSILSELKSGNASVDSISSILEANKPENAGPKPGEDLDRLAAIHDVLNPEQRTKFMKISSKNPAHGPHGGPEGQEPRF